MVSKSQFRSLGLRFGCVGEKARRSVAAQGDDVMQTSSPHRLRIITVLVVLALAGASGAPAAAQDVVTIHVFWSTWGPIYDELMTRIGERYEAEHPGVK